MADAQDSGDAPSWSLEHGGHWVATTHASCRAVAAAAETFSSAGGVHVPPTGLFLRGIRIFALEHDDPVHWDHREILRAAVGDRPRAVDEDLIRECLAALLDQIDWSGPVDLMASLANPLPLDVVFSLIGADPEFKPEMKALVDALMRRTAGVHADPAARVHEIAQTMVERRLADPRDDWISRLSTTECQGTAVTVAEQVAAVVSLITGGHHSTSRGLGSLLARLLTEPGLRDRLLADPALIPAAVEETLRLHTPLPEFSRTALRDTNVYGADVREGQPVQMRYDEANRDPAVFPDPEDFRLDRPRALHLAFGHGLHRCIGLHLARAELGLAAEELLRRAPDVELVDQVRWLGPAEPESLLVVSPSQRAG